MRSKISIAVTSALFTVATLEASGSPIPQNDTWVQAHAISYNKDKTTQQLNAVKIVPEKSLSGVYTYIVRLQDKPIATYDGRINGLAATNLQIAKKALYSTLKKSSASPSAIRNQLKIDSKAKAVQQYSAYLAEKQASFHKKAQSTLGQSVSIIANYKTVFNGMAMQLTQDEAIALSKLSDVAFVQRERLETLDTDRGPTLIGAPNVWDGTATGVGAQGEGVIIGIVDSGINSDHPSFADIGGDGYDHTNPWGAGVYVGDCAQGFPELCNDKLIGVRSYSAITDAYRDSSVFGETPPPANGEDYNGHGSHVGSTAGGNILPNTPIYAPEIGKEEGDGTPSDITFEQVSGVAPHANIVSYQICWPGESGDTYSACPTSAILMALEDAVSDGVDVLNYSISGGGNPWQSSTELAFLAAQEAGIFAAVSAGNSGPSEYTTPKNAPWYTVVGASTHGRTISGDKTIDSFSGGNTSLGSISGQSITGSITAPIVYAGDFTNSNDPDGDSGQCLKPFPENTFSGQIVVCDRGEIARVEKAANVAAGGAGGYVLVNTPTGADNLVADIYVIPGIHIASGDGTSLKSWLASGANHQATINAGGEINIGQADDMAGFSSRGPNNTVENVMTPSVTAPGVSIYAAYADQMFGHDNTGPAPSDFSFLSGTSMSSPHVAGAAALLKSAHPTWTPDNIRSALMMTASMDVRKEDGSTTADFFDMGAGSIRVDLAAQTGLIMNESSANYQAANPNIGGTPKSLNIPSMMDVSCVITCSWTRTLTATKAGTWSTSSETISGGAVISVSPSSFTLTEGQSQEITVTVDSSATVHRQRSLGNVLLTSAEHPNLHLPVAIVANKGEIPANATFTTNRQTDSGVIAGVKTVAAEQLAVRSYGLAKAQLNQDTLAEDSARDSIYDDTKDGVSVVLFDVPANAKRFITEITASDSPDLDLYVGIDANDDGIPQESEQIASSTTYTAIEKVDIALPTQGKYWVAIQNWSASAPGAEDGFTLSSAVIDGEEKEGLAIAVDGPIQSLVPFDLRVIWSLDNAAEGERFYGALDLGSNADEAGNLGLISIDVDKGVDDVTLSNNASARVAAGDTIAYTASIIPNTGTTDKNYTIEATLPSGVTLIENSVTGSPTINGNTITWQTTVAPVPDGYSSYIRTDNGRHASCMMPDLGQSNSGGYVDLAALGFTPDAATGDNQTATFAVPAVYYGQQYQTVNVTDDGFIYFSGNTGDSGWIGQRLPSSVAPNNLIAPLWRDMQLVSSETSGITVATIGQYTVIEWDDMRTYQYHSGQTDVTDVADFQVVIDNNSRNFYIAYDNIEHAKGDQLGVSIGYENQDGSFGENYVYHGSGDPINSVTSVTSGLVLCYQYDAIDDPTELTFSVEVNSDANAGALAVALSSNRDDEFTQSETVPLATPAAQIEGAPTAVITGATSANGGTSVTLSGSSSSDPNNDALSYSWSQTGGTSVSFNSSSESITFTAPSAGGQLSFELTVNDGNGNSASATHSVSVTAVNTGGGNDSSGGGGGSVTWLLLLLVPITARRILNK